MISRKIKEVRLTSEMTQDELAEKSGLSLRTIQRIESGDSEPRSDSLKRIAEALNVQTETLKGLSLERSEDDFKKRKKILHLSALSFCIFPFAGVLIPGIVWMVFRDKDKSIDKEGIKAVTFQALWYLVTILTGVIYYMWMFDQIDNMSTVSPSTVTDMFGRVFWIIAALLLTNIGFILWSAFRQEPG